MHHAIAGACCALAALTASAAETRAPDEAELKAFHAYYQQQFPDNHSAPPVFSITRAAPAAPWVMAARIDLPAKRGLRTLCRSERVDFRYNGRWEADARRRQLVWLDAKGCRPAAAVELAVPMPDADVLGLLERQQTLLKSARLLFAGNTSCAKSRSYNFAPVRIEVGTAGSSSEVMAAVVYRSDHNTTATVWVRRNGLEYDAWNVSCA